MNDSETMPSRISRRGFMGGAFKAGVMAGAASMMPGITQQAWAAGETLNAYGVTTAALKDWSVMTKSTGITVNFTPVSDDVANFMREVTSNGITDSQDLVVFVGGPQRILGPQGYFQVLDESRPELTLWKQTSDEWKRAGWLRADDKQYGSPVIGNGDSFGYFPEKLDVNKNGEDEISWGRLFEDESLKGRAAVDRYMLTTMCEAANFLKQHDRLKVEDAGDLPPEAARATVDYLIGRKKAGQFRTVFSSFEEQVQLLSNREVDLINCWEPAVRDANDALGAGTAAYAFTAEGYLKWGHGAFVPASVKSPEKLAEVYKAINYLLGGEYHAYQARDRGYAGPNMNLAVEYAKQNNWSKEDVDALSRTEARVARKFKKPFFNNLLPENSGVMEEEWQRFLNA